MERILKQVQDDEVLVRMTSFSSGQTRMRISFIATVLNEEKTVEKLLDSLMVQTQKADEIIIVDGGSSDNTLEKIKSFQKKYSTTIIHIIVVKSANRAVGRNKAIKMATGEIIVMSDAGCELEKRWVEEIIKPFEDGVGFIRPPLAETPRKLGGKGVAFDTIDVVAGYYQVSKNASVFGKCVACYALVMPDKVDQDNFLPSSRSMAIRKSVFEKFGGFPEDFSDNEDYVLANKLQKGGGRIVFAKEAVVYWQPRENLKDFFLMIFRFARGDAKAGLRRGKVATVFGRYAAIGLIWLIGSIWLGILGVLGYLGWSIAKNYDYVRNWKAFIYLPVLQITADLAVMAGTIL